MSIERSPAFEITTFDYGHSSLNRIKFFFMLAVLRQSVQGRYAPIYTRYFSFHKKCCRGRTPLIGNTVSDLINPRFETQTFGSRDRCFTARPTPFTTYSSLKFITCKAGCATKTKKQKIHFVMLIEKSPKKTFLRIDFCFVMNADWNVFGGKQVIFLKYRGTGLNQSEKEYFSFYLFVYLKIFNTISVINIGYCIHKLTQYSK